MKNKTEQRSCKLIEQAFRTTFDDVAVYDNLVISLPNGFRLPTGEIDCVVVCNAGVFLFEVKGWNNTHVSREPVVGSDQKQWFLNSAAGASFIKTQVRDPIAQGLEKTAEIRRHLDARVNLRSLVYLGGPNVSVDARLPSSAITEADLPFLLRGMYSDSKRSNNRYRLLDAEGVDLVASLIHGLGEGNSIAGHMQAVMAARSTSCEESVPA
jgi:hypothetical protein